MEKLNNFIITSTTVNIIKNDISWKKLKPWISTGPIASIQHRDKMKRQLLKNYSSILENEYKNNRNLVNNLIRKTYTRYELYKSKIVAENHN